MKTDSPIPCLVALAICLAFMLFTANGIFLKISENRSNSISISETIPITPTTIPTQASTVTVEPLSTPTPVITPTVVKIELAPIVDIRIFKLTAYCICAECCKKTDGIGFGGIKVQAGVSIAADLSVLPLGTVVDIEGIGLRTVQDKGSKVIGDHIDLLLSDHNACLDFGVQYRMVTIFQKEK